MFGIICAGLAKSTQVLCHHRGIHADEKTNSTTLSCCHVDLLAVARILVHASGRSILMLRPLALTCDDEVLSLTPTLRGLVPTGRYCHLSTPTPPATDDSIMQRVRKRMRSVYEEVEEEEEEQPEEVQDTDTVLPVHGDATLHACSAALERRRTALLQVNQRARPFSSIVQHSVTLPDNVPSKSAWVNGLVTPASSPIYHDHICELNPTGCVVCVYCKSSSTMADCPLLI